MLGAKFRTGIDATTGQLMRGWDHVQQSIGKIMLTRLGEVVMLLDYGSDVRSWLAENVTPEMALGLYNDLVGAVHHWEPEYRISALQLVHLTRDASLGLRHAGTYYPEGRLGNYALAIPIGYTFIALREPIARRTAA